MLINCGVKSFRRRFRHAPPHRVLNPTITTYSLPRESNHNKMLLSLSIAPILLVAVAVLFVYKYFFWSGFLSPLARIPGAHPIAPYSSLWILWTRYRKLELQTIHQAHLKHGPIVRLGPSELSVNCVDGGIRTIYSGGFDKHDWYPNIFENYG